jgi:hypothetical protein
MEGANKKKASEKNTTIAFETRKKEIAFLCINSLTVYGCKKFCLKTKSKTKLLKNQAPWSSLIFLPLPQIWNFHVRTMEIPLRRVYNIAHP